MMKIEDMSDQIRELSYREWQNGIKNKYKRIKRLPLMDEDEFARQLKNGGVSINPDYCVATVMHHDKPVFVEVPMSVAAQYTLNDITTHAAYLLARMQHPSRVRIVVGDDMSFALQVIE